MNRQAEIIKFALTHDNKITTDQANDLLAGTYYHNGKHYVSEILSRMVRNQTLQRGKRGLYKLISIGPKVKKVIDHPSQNKLF